MKSKNNKTIGISVRFWTNGLEIKNNLNRIHSCWDSGVVTIEANSEKGIKSQSPLPFNNMDDLPKAIHAVLRKAKVIQATENKKGRF